MFFQKGALKNFTIFKRKHVLESLFNKFASLQARKETPNRCFPVNIAKFSRTPFFTELIRLLLYQDWIFLLIAVLSNRAPIRGF